MPLPNFLKKIGSVGLENLSLPPKEELAAIQRKKTGAVMENASNAAEEENSPETPATPAQPAQEEVVQPNPAPVPAPAQNEGVVRTGPAVKKAPEAKVKPSEVKGFGYFTKRINEIKDYLAFVLSIKNALTLLQYFPDDGENHPILENLGIERGQVVEILVKLFGQFTSDYDTAEEVSYIGDSNNRGSVMQFLFEDVLKFKEETDSKAIDAKLAKFFGECKRLNKTKNPFFDPKRLSRIAEIAVSARTRVAQFDDPRPNLNIKKGDKIPEGNEIEWTLRMIGRGGRPAKKVNFLEGPDQASPSEKKSSVIEAPVEQNSEVLEAALEIYHLDNEIGELLELANMISNTDSDEPIMKEFSGKDIPFFNYFMENHGIPSDKILSHVLDILEQDGVALNAKTVGLHLKNLAQKILPIRQEIINRA